jgi:hypothetical protein
MVAVRVTLSLVVGEVFDASSVVVVAVRLDALTVSVMAAEVLVA